jgi:hypothetical protein
VGADVVLASELRADHAALRAGGRADVHAALATMPASNGIQAVTWGARQASRRGQDERPGW